MIKRIVEKLMSVPSLYQAVQNFIAGPLHSDIKKDIMLIVPDEERIRVLDIGCGVGDYSSLFKHANYVGIDIDPVYIRTAEKLFGKDHNNIKFETVDASEFDYPSASFNYCFSVGLYHHMPDELVIKSLNNAIRIVGSGNVIVFDAIFPPSGNIIGYILRLIDRGKFVRTYQEYERLLSNSIKVKEISARRAGFLDYIYYRL